MSAPGGAGSPEGRYDGSESDEDWIDDEQGSELDDGDLDDEDLEVDETEVADLKADCEDCDDDVSCASDSDVPAKISQEHLSAHSLADLDTTDTIKNLLKDIVNLFKTSSLPLREGVLLAIDFIDATSGNRFLKRITEAWIKIALTFWKQVAQREETTGQRDVPGTALNIVLQYIALQFRGHPLIRMPDAVREDVKKQPHRDHIRFQFRARFNSMRSIIRHAQKHLGLGTLGRLHQATIDPRLPKRPKTIVLVNTIGGLGKVLTEALALSAATPDDTVLRFPRLEAYFQVAFFLRNLHGPQVSRRSRSGLKRKHTQVNNSDLDADGNDGENLDQAEPAPVDSTTMPAEESASHQAASEALDDLLPSRLAFEDLNHLKQWKVRAASRFRELAALWTLRADAIHSSFSETVTVLMVCSMLLSQRDVPSSLVTIAQVFVATIREEYEQDPSLANRLRLCNSLGALIIIYTQASRKFEAMRAAEESLSCLQPLYEDNPSKHLPLMANLKVAYCHSLISTAKADETTYSSRNRVGILGKSSRVATQAVDLARTIFEATPTDLKSKWTLAYALFLKDHAYRELRDAFSALIVRYPKRILEVEFPKLFAKVDGWSENNIDGAVAAIEECISMYRQLVEDFPRLFDQLLANALESAADTYAHHPQPNPKKSIAYHIEAITILRRLSGSFPGLFGNIVGSSYISLAQRLRWDNQLVEADEAFGEAVKLCPEGNNLLGPLMQSRALLCFRLERYQEALVHAATTAEVIPEGGNPSEIRTETRLGASAVQGFCTWVLGAGKAEDVLHILESCVSTSMFKGSRFEQPSRIFYVGNRQFTFCLMLGWMGAVRCALGQRTDARECGEQALKVTRALLESQKAKSSMKRVLEHSHHVLPHLLVLLAGTHLEAGRQDKAKEAVQESLELGEAADGPTRKTALLLKARLLDRDGWRVEAAAVRAEAETIAFKGFLEALGC